MQRRFLLSSTVVALMLSGFLTVLPASAAQPRPAVVASGCSDDPDAELIAVYSNGYWYYYPDEPVEPSCSGSGPGQNTSSGSSSLGDGRCNLAPDQTVAVYPDGKGGYAFYAVNVGVGTFAFSITDDQLESNPARTSNYLVYQADGVQLYRLSDGTLLVTRIKPDGKAYSFDMGSCGAVDD